VDRDRTGWAEQRHEERQALDMIEMVMSQEEVDLVRKIRVRPREPRAEDPQPGPASKTECLVGDNST